MQELTSHRTMAIILTLAAVAFTASGVPDNKGVEAAIGWIAFLGLALAFLVLASAALARRLRNNRTAAAQPVPQSPARSEEIA